MDQPTVAHGDPLNVRRDVSAAGAGFQQDISEQVMVAPVTMYSTRFCPYCVAARRLLTEKGVGFEDISVDGDNALRHEMTQRSGRRTVPQIWIGDTHVGGYTDLAALERRGELDRLLAGV